MYWNTDNFYIIVSSKPLLGCFVRNYACVHTHTHTHLHADTHTYTRTHTVKSNNFFCSRHHPMPVTDSLGGFMVGKMSVCRSQPQLHFTRHSHKMTNGFYILVFS